MIFIVVKWTIKPERSGEWLSLVDDFTQATRNEPGNIFFEWSRSVDNPDQFVLVEAFQDDAAAAHVNSGALQGVRRLGAHRRGQHSADHQRPGRAGQRLGRDGGGQARLTAAP